MSKKWIWSYRLTSRNETNQFDTDIVGHIVMPTQCGVTVATELSNRYETYFVDFLNCLGEAENA